MKPNEYKISIEKFNFVNNSDKIRDKELSTKPVSYIKDAFSRFKRNKASILAAIIIGALILFAVIAPMISPYSVSYQTGKKESNNTSYEDITARISKNLARSWYLSISRNIR